MRCSLDYASNWEIRGGVWRYGVELSKALVDWLGPEYVSLPCFDILPEERLQELKATGAKVANNGIYRYYDRLQSMQQRNGRFIPWKKVLPWFYGPHLQNRLFQKGVGKAQVYHALFTCRGKPACGVTVGTIHDLIPLLHAKDAGFEKERFLSILEDFRRWATLIIVPSQATRDDLAKHGWFPSEKIRVVYHGIDHTRFHSQVDFPDDLLKQHQLQPGQFLLYVGAVERRKNIERLLEAHRWAVAERIDLPLVIAGAVVHEIPAFQQARSDRSGRVKYIGYVSDKDLPGLYRAARGLLHVALAEGFGFTPLEAMACGTPVIASRQTATGEIVSQGGELVNAYQVDEIAEAIRRLLIDNDWHRDLSQQGLQHARQFTWRRCAEATYAVYQEAWQRGHP
ncbi:MAG TPA: glycosyltransferase family 1 protein [Gemmatales bacterium]|nr:glycosyltransferase family 1 protein [Gemmatales bacterium]HMP15881.1 glycosyltransferase family 1 protein [Gemmatales bacterium]